MSEQTSVCVGCGLAEWEPELDPLYPASGRCRWRPLDAPRDFVVVGPTIYRDEHFSRIRSCPVREPLQEEPQ